MPMRRINASVLAALTLTPQTLLAAGQDPGRMVAEEIRGCTKAISNPFVQSFVDALGQKLAAQWPKRDFPFTVSVIEEDLSPQAHEPIGLPGGHMFVPAALFAAAQDEAEFAGVLAQAMGQSHVMEEDLARAGLRGYMLTDLLQSFVCAFPGPIPMGYFNAQRSVERRADLATIPAMARAGFDPNALVRYVERVQAARGRVGEVFSVLPPVKKRVARMKAEIAKLPPRAYPATDSAGFIEATEQVRRVLAAAAKPRPDAPSLKRK